MKKIIVGCCKGGASKSTTAYCLAVAFAKMGKSVFILDADHIPNSCKWAALRESRDILPAITVAARRGNVSCFIRTLEQSGAYDYCIIDVKGSTTKELISAMAVADILLVPVVCSQHDFDNLVELEVEIAASREAFENDAMKVLMYQTRAVTHAGRKGERESFKISASDFPEMTLLDSVGTERKSYRLTAETGFGVSEMKDPVAIEEINSLAQEILDHA